MGIGDEEAMGYEQPTQQGIRDRDLKWHRTPWYIFWRPKWRRFTLLHGFHDERDREYATDQERARQVLEERCCPTRPFTWDT